MGREVQISDEEILAVAQVFIEHAKKKGWQNEMLLFRKWLADAKKESDSMVIPVTENINGESITTQKNIKLPSYSTVLNRFGSWYALLERLNAKPPEFLETKRILKTYELTDIREHFLRCRENGDNAFTPRKYQNYSREIKEAPRYRQILFQHDNWDMLLQKLNDAFPQDNWLAHSLENIEKIPQKSKGKRPANWNQLTDEEQRLEMKKTLLQVSLDNNGDLSPKIYIRSEAYPNISTIIRRFGTWEKAVRATQQWFIEEQKKQRYHEWIKKQRELQTLKALEEQVQTATS